MKLSRRKMMAGAMLTTLLVIGFAAVRVVFPPSRAVHEEKQLYYCPMHPSYTSDRAGDCPICNMKLVRREPAVPPPASAAPPARAAEEVCRLHNCPRLHEGRPCPMLVVAAAGEKVTCPVCGTHVAGGDAAEAIPSEAPAGYAAVLLSPQKRQFIGVKTAPVQRRSIRKTIRTVGRIAYDPELYQAQTEYLQARQVLAGLRRPEGVSAPAKGQAERLPLEEAAPRALAQRLAEAARLRLRLLGFGDELVAELEGSEGPDRSLLVADPKGRVWLYAPVYEFELPLVKVGQTIRVEAQAISGKRWEGEVRAIDPVLDPMTRSARVRTVLSDPAGLLKPEMYVNASIEVALGEVLAIPEEAVFDTGTRRIAFADKGEGLFEPRDLILGARAEGFFEVKGGVAEGESVVTSGNFLIDSESRLKAALEGMGGGTGHQHGQ